MPRLYELTTTDLRAELAYRERALERATSGSTAELERGIAAVKSELARRERYTAEHGMYREPAKRPAGDEFPFDAEPAA